MNYLIVHRHIKDPLPSNVGRATALVTRYVSVQDFTNLLLNLGSLSMNRLQTAADLITYERKTILKAVERGG